MSRNTLLALLVPLALVIAAVMLWRGAPVVPPPAPEAESTAKDKESELPRIALGKLGTGESKEILATLPTRIDYPLQDKYREQVWSDVPHELIAAYDGLEASNTEGSRRLFIAVVSPELSDAHIAQLVRDLRARHQDAEVLRVRIFDSQAAATHPSWTNGGATRKAHLVANFYRNGDRERFLLRGIEVDP